MTDAPSKPIDPGAAAGETAEELVAAPETPATGLFYRPDPAHPERLLPRDSVAPVAADLTVSAMHGAFRAFVLNPLYTCVGAKSAIHKNGYRIGVYAELGSAAATAALARDLAAFLREVDDIDAAFATFVAVFEHPQDTDEERFERALWAQLQALHDADTVAWDPTVSDDPRDPHFSFSFAGTALFIVGLHPGSARLSRRFPWPALVFNPHAQFERLRAEGHYRRMQAVIRGKERALQGDINPSLDDFGGESEAKQYSGRKVEAGWQPPFVAHSGAPAPALATLTEPRPRPGQRYRIPPQSGVAFLIDRGQTLRIIDPQGKQVADLYSVGRDDPRETLSSGRSIDYADTLYLTTGDVLYSNRERPMWTIGHDDVRRHDFVLTPCSPEMFRRMRGDDGTHPSCFENLRAPMGAFGVTADQIGSTFNVFMDVEFDRTTGKMTIAPPASRAGDRIELRAEQDMVVGLTACSSEVTNDGALRPIDFEVVAAADASAGR